MGLFQVRLLLRFFLIFGLMLVTLVTGMATGFILFYRLLYTLAMTVVLGFFWTWLGTRSLAVKVDRRTLQARVGDPIEETFTAINESLLPKHNLEVEDISDLPGYSGGVAVSLKSNGSRTWSTGATARKRGLYTLGPVRVSVADPFSVFRRERLFGGTDTLTIFPQTHDLPGFEVPSSDLSGDSSTRRHTLAVTPHASSVREYASGDSLSRVHWNTTARLNKLMSKVFDLGRASEVWVMPDLEAVVHAGELEESTDEYAVSIAASLAQRYLDAELPVGLIAHGAERYYLPAETGNAQLNRIMRYLAVSKADGETPLSIGVAREEPLWGHQSSLIVITPSPSEDWVIALRELARRGVKVVVVLVDGGSFGGSLNTLDAVEPLYDAGLPSYVVKKGDDIAVALSRRNDAIGNSARRELEEAGLKA